MDDKHIGKASPHPKARPQAPGPHPGPGRFGHKKLPKKRETLHHGRLPEGNGATGKPAFFPPHP